ncbi:MAG: DUF882 domain-containing protein [Cohaesibacteraceae bacterium]|nr:DUF882 domain-containing protein [Cohaesibacteraceae bacterium]MBL4876672.1 DUF882 domain-containing protein [Cohaesibacteraceae bacterium]
MELAKTFARLRVPILCMYALLVGIMVFFISEHAAASQKSLKLFNTNTRETTVIVFKKNGRYVPEGLRAINRMMRDWRRNEIIDIDPSLLDVVWDIYRATGTNKPIHLVSGYRSPATNKMLRSRNKVVAKNSLHTQGKAMDFYIPGVSAQKLRNLGLQLHLGGVGHYPRSKNPFVHIDTGTVRHWPRLSRGQLARVFPAGNTMHVPRGGTAFSGYKRVKSVSDRTKSNMRRNTQLALAKRTTRSQQSTAAKRTPLFGGLFARKKTKSTAQPVQTPAVLSTSINSSSDSDILIAAIRQQPSPKPLLLERLSRHATEASGIVANVTESQQATIGTNISNQPLQAGDASQLNDPLLAAIIGADQLPFDVLPSVRSLRSKTSDDNLLVAGLSRKEPVSVANIQIPASTILTQPERSSIKIQSSHASLGFAARSTSNPINNLLETNKTSRTKFAEFASIDVGETSTILDNAPARYTGKSASLRDLDQTFEIYNPSVFEPASATLTMYAALSLPNPSSIVSLYEVPKSMIYVQFTGSAIASMKKAQFKGPSVQALRTITFY